MAEEDNPRYVDVSREVPRLAEIPENITPSSSNVQVKLFLFDLLLRYDSDRTKVEAWNLVKAVKGNGEGILDTKEDHWIRMFGEVEGPMMFRKIEREKLRWEKTLATDVSNVILFYTSHAKYSRQTQFGLIFDTLLRFFVRPTRAPPSLKASRRTSSRSPSPLRSQPLSTEPSAASSSPSFHRPDSATLGESRSSCKSKLEVKEMRCLGGPRHDETSGLRRRHERRMEPC